MTFRFFQAHPALYYGLIALLCAAAVFQGSLFYGALLFFVVALGGARAALGLPLALAIALYIYTSYYTAPYPEEGVKTTVLFTPHQLSSSQKFGKKQWSYEGTALLSNRKIPCHILWKGNGDPPSPNSLYEISGTLFFHNSPRAAFRATKWKAVSPLPLGSQWRQDAKHAIQMQIKRSIPYPVAASFLSGLVTGEYSENSMKKDFSRFGLQHILAISGFHFSLIALVLHSLLRSAFQYRYALYCTAFFLTLYLFLLGYSPSVVRAWAMALIAFWGTALGRRPVALNSLGCALFALVIYDPPVVFHLGFQFSFLTTASILLFYSPSKDFISFFIPIRTFKDALQLSLIEQHGYLILSYLRETLALTVCVSLTSIPLTLLYFHQFPLLSLIYNLFFPFGVAILFPIFILLLPLSWVAYPLVSPLMRAIGWATQHLLDTTSELPTTLDRSLSMTVWTQEFLSLYLLFLLLFAMVWRKGEGQTVYTV